MEDCKLQPLVWQVGVQEGWFEIEMFKEAPAVSLEGCGHLPGSVGGSLQAEAATTAANLNPAQ